MKLKLHEIKEPLSFSFSEENGWLKAVFTHLKLSFQGPVSIGLEITKDKDIIFFQGHLKVSLTLPCSRCVENMAYEIDEFFSPVFAHGKDPHREKAELSLEDLDITYFDKDEIGHAACVGRCHTTNAFMFNGTTFSAQTENELNSIINSKKSYTKNNFGWYADSNSVYFNNKPTINNATILITLIIGLIAGPAVSLYGSPTVSPVTAA